MTGPCLCGDPDGEIVMKECPKCGFNYPCLCGPRETRDFCHQCGREIKKGETVHFTGMGKAICTGCYRRLIDGIHNLGYTEIPSK